MRVRMLCAVVCLTLAVARSAAAADTAVFPVQGTNLSQGELAAIGSLIASSCSAQANRPVVTPADAEPLLTKTRSERDAALALGVGQYVHVEAVRLTTRIALQASLHDTHDSVLAQVRATALSLDDMEVVADRVAAALWQRTSLADTRTIDTVTGREARGKNRLFLEKVFGGRFALVLPVARHLDAQPTLLLQFDARLEQNDYFLELALGFLVPNADETQRGISGLVGQLGASYYLTHTNIAPYIGGGLSPRIFLGTYSYAGAAVDAHVGVMFMRESSTRIYVELQVDQNLIAARPAALHRYDPQNASAPLVNVYPTEFSLAAGMGF